MQGLKLEEAVLMSSGDIWIIGLFTAPHQASKMMHDASMNDIVIVEEEEFAS
jgi:hypothetical protein